MKVPAYMRVHAEARRRTATGGLQVASSVVLHLAALKFLWLLLGWLASKAWGIHLFLRLGSQAFYVGTEDSNSGPHT